MLVTEPADFEGFVVALSQPATTRTLPPPSVEPPDLGRLAAVAAEYGIQILGPQPHAADAPVSQPGRLWAEYRSPKDDL